jgi:hypothetical protein
MDDILRSRRRTLKQASRSTFPGPGIVRKEKKGACLRHAGERTDIVFLEVVFALWKLDLLLLDGEVGAESVKSFS